MPSTSRQIHVSRDIIFFDERACSPDLVQIPGSNPGNPVRFYQRLEWDTAVAPLPSSFRVLTIDKNEGAITYGPFPNFELLPGGIHDWLEWGDAITTKGLAIKLLFVRDDADAKNETNKTVINHTISFPEWRQVLLSGDRSSLSGATSNIEQAIQLCFQKTGKAWMDEIMVNIRRTNSQQYFRNREAETEKQLRDQREEIATMKRMQIAAEAAAASQNKRKKPDTDSDTEDLDVAEVLKTIMKLKKK